MSEISGNANVCAVNSMAYLQKNGASINFADGYDDLYLENSSAVCFLTEDCMESYQVSPGDPVTCYVSVPRYDLEGRTLQYIDIGMCTLHVAGVVSYSEDKIADMIVPIRWLWKQEQTAGIENVCDFFQGTVAQPLDLNTFKSLLPDCGLGEIDQNARENYRGTALLINDKRYIEYAEQMIKSISLFEQYLIPFFLMVFIMITVLSFLIFRSDRKEMAIAFSLGRSRFNCGLSYFISILLSDLFGAGIALLPVFFLIHDGILLLKVYAAFFLCVSVGVGLCMLLMSRNDVWGLLSQTE